MPKALRELLPSVQKSDTSDDRRNKRPIITSFKDNAVSVEVGGIVIDVDHGVSVDLRPPFMTDTSPFLYDYGASKDEFRTNRHAAFFFLDKDLHPGTKINLYFTRRTTKVKFLPRQVADMMPFSSNKFSEILHTFSIKRNSTKAEIMRKTIKECEKPALQGEHKYCATSLEAMVDFSASKLGKNIQVLVTEIDKDSTQPQQFVITEGVKKVGSKIVACHVQDYVYPIFYCHATHTAKAYMVPLVGTNDTNVKAVAVCHTDTSKWNPRHLAFQVLKVKPGAVPICHFLPTDHFVWVAN
ncbi:hypothetical protein MANES_03G020400v8 [Manihot esculenta]|uniref:BURP domain-containing protein n=1 Tax=Manihot esculenta TaxID=3983 RepID=A0A2C9W3T4_MANES|nr:hypothetical protein MANES_03G020400v8 [Manihot esculenta]